MKHTQWHTFERFIERNKSNIVFQNTFRSYKILKKCESSYRLIQNGFQPIEKTPAYINIKAHKWTNIVTFLFQLIKYSLIWKKKHRISQKVVGDKRYIKTKRYYVSALFPMEICCLNERKYYRREFFVMKMIFKFFLNFILFLNLLSKVVSVEWSLWSVCLWFERLLNWTL